ncbi:Pyrrolo-quinoline quinone [Beutenbergia cavernae DSM 12333]|uniref:Pyrrolo-quinoline quinone n=1 Tax=Beutenbergia cavernae (strain ATCC BAA-8 / DSM 12333 / CCUG 43141 / JCM 11478 / NBRC 16432 / NCIMB 13614 / HKI 0122) TaxID=471853 RepID=C5BUY1_BEUC1|nr:zinc metallochaperone AztD [Beutenbergia cavernae]ACQ78355.1 Pyrrolo-quinoline quinone [Beutenbergia cavernae DSM 12333]
MTSDARLHRRRLVATTLGLVLPAVLLASCATEGEGGTGDDGAAPAATEEAPTSDATEAATATPRLAVTYDGGIQVLDAATLEVVDDIELAGFNRLNPAGDGRHLVVSTSGGFQVLDAGAWAVAHGDHAHYYTAPPVLTDVVYEAGTPGHVVVHDGRTALFDDATGHVVVTGSGDVALGDVDREHTTPSAHHGVAVELSDGTLVVSEGTEEARTGIRVLDAAGQEIAASDECPGVHGEAVAADEAVVVGCEDGVLVVLDGVVTKVASPDAYGRIGNQAGSEASPIVLGDYKSDRDAELERPTRVSLVDTRSGEMRLVDLPASYTFRSLARGDDGEALVLGTDGQVHVIDPATGDLTASIPVIEPWEEPEEWQSPRPAILTLDGSVYVTDPATNRVLAVDVPTGEVWQSAELGVTPNEIAGVSGDVEAGASAEHEHEDEHEDGHDH